MRYLTIILCAFFLLTCPVFALAAQRDITVYAYHDPIEKIITYGHGGNYPECALVSLVLTEIDPETGKRIFYRHMDYDSPLEVKIEASSSSEALYTLSFIMDGAPLPFGSSSMDISIDPPKWKGLFYGWGNSSTWLPLALDPLPTSIPTLETAKHKLDLFTKAIFSPLIVAQVYSWNYHPGASSVDLKITAQKDGSSVKVENPNITVSLDMDNVDFVRQKIPTGQEGTFQGDPGLFLVKGGGKDFYGNDRTYNQIGQVISDIQQGKLQVSGGGGPDWLQVAAADMCNTKYYTSEAKIFNCVHKIIAKHIDGPVGGEAEFGKGIIFLNASLEEIRFNDVGCGGGFFMWRTRDFVIRHESLHNYHFGPGLGWLVDDKDNDRLYIEKGDGGRYIRFSQDSLGRGFIRFKGEGFFGGFGGGDYVNRYLNGEYGDNAHNNSLYPRFLENLTAEGILGSGTLMNILKGQTITFTSKVIPDDLPVEQVDLEEIKLYAYNPILKQPFCWPNAGGHDYVPLDLIVEHEVGERVEREFSGGYYDARLWKFDTIDYGQGGDYLGYIVNKLLQLNAQGYQLYLAVDLGFEDSPFEFDASYFGIDGG